MTTILRVFKLTLKKLLLWHTHSLGSSHFIVLHFFNLSTLLFAMNSTIRSGLSLLKNSKMNKHSNARWINSKSYLTLKAVTLLLLQQLQTKSLPIFTRLSIVYPQSRTNRIHHAKNHSLSKSETRIIQTRPQQKILGLYRTHCWDSEKSIFSSKFWLSRNRTLEYE